MTPGTTELVNIGSKETQKRLFLGVAMVAVGVVLAAILSRSGINRGWYWGLFPPFWIGTLALYQARKKT